MAPLLCPSAAVKSDNASIPPCGGYGLPEVVFTKEAVIVGVLDSDVDCSCSLPILQHVPHVDGLVGG